jgi:hypothetical protein
MAWKVAWCVARLIKKDKRLSENNHIIALDMNYHRNRNEKNYPDLTPRTTSKTNEN